MFFFFFFIKIVENVVCVCVFNALLQFFYSGHHIFTLPRVFSNLNSHPTKTKQTNTLSQFSLCRSHTLNRSSSTKCQLGSSTENDRSLSQIPIPTFANIIFGFDRRYCSVLLRGRPETETSSLIIVWDFC